MTYLVATIEVVYDEIEIIRQMLETGEYGINGYPITEQSMIEFVKNTEFGIDHETCFKAWSSPLYASVKDEDGNDLWAYEYTPETIDNPAQTRQDTTMETEKEYQVIVYGWITAKSLAEAEEIYAYGKWYPDYHIIEDENGQQYDPYEIEQMESK